MRLALLASLLIACGGSQRRAAEPPAHRDNTEEPPPAVVDRALLADVAAGIEEVLAAMAQITAGADCVAMGGELSSLFDRSKPLFELADAQRANDEAARILRGELEARGERVKPMVDAISAGLSRCMKEPSVVEAMQKMPTL